MTTGSPDSPDAESTLEAIYQTCCERRVLVRMPKSDRSTVAEALASIIDDFFSIGDDICWL